MPSNHPILCCSLLLLPSIFPSIRVFSNQSALRIRWPKYWSFRFNISPSSEYQDWFHLGWTSWISLQSKGLQESSPTPQFKSISSSVLNFLYSPTINPYMTTGKTIALTRWTFVGKAMSLLSNMLSRLVITFLQRSKSINFMAAVTICSDFGAQKNKVCHCFHGFRIYWLSTIIGFVYIILFIMLTKTYEASTINILISLIYFFHLQNVIL